MPELRGLAGLAEVERDRGPRPLGEGPHPPELVRDVDVLEGHLEDAAATSAVELGPQGVGEGEQLVGLREGARDVPSVGGLVERGARGRDAQRSGGERLLGQPLHGEQVLGRGRLVGGAALAHHVAPQRAMGELVAVIDDMGRRADDIEELAEGLPSPRDAFGERRARDVLDPFHQLDEPVLMAVVHGGEAHPAVPSDHRRHPVPARRREPGVPRGLAVEVGVDVDEPWRDQQAIGVDRSASRPGRTRLDDLDDAIAVDGHVGDPSGGPRPIDDQPRTDDQVVHGRSVSPTFAGRQGDVRPRRRGSPGCRRWHWGPGAGTCARPRRPAARRPRSSARSPRSSRPVRCRRSARRPRASGR